MEKRTLTQLKRERDTLLSYYNVTSDPRVQAQIEIVRNERAPKVAELDKQIEAARKAQPEKKPRWPENTPKEVLELCERYWRGTTEYASFRIHCWNDKLVCTSYPSGGYSDNGGWHPTPATFHFLHRFEKETWGAPARIGQDLIGRQSQRQLEATMKSRT